MADPQAVFDGNPRKQELLKSLWSELYDAHKRVAAGERGDEGRIPFCAVYRTHGTAVRVPATARSSLNGHPICAACLGPRKSYPLAYVKPERPSR